MTLKILTNTRPRRKSWVTFFHLLYGKQQTLDGSISTAERNNVLLTGRLKNDPPRRADEDFAPQYSR